MKPRTKLEKRVTELSGKLPAITKEQEDWAKAMALAVILGDPVCKNRRRR